MYSTKYAIMLNQPLIRWRCRLLWASLALLALYLSLGFAPLAASSIRTKTTPPISSEANLTFFSNLSTDIVAKAYAQEKPQPKEVLMGWFNVSRYYTPVRGQARYLNGWKPGKVGQCAVKNLTWMPSSGGSYSAEACMNGGGNDVYTTADGTDLRNEKPYTTVACSRWMLGYRIRIEGFGEVICHDTGGAIHDGRLDMWVGYGDVGFQNYMNGDSIPYRVRVYHVF